MDNKHACYVRVARSTLHKKDITIFFYEYERILMALRQRHRRIKNYSRPWEARKWAAQNQLLLRKEREI